MGVSTRVTQEAECAEVCETLILDILKMGRMSRHRKTCRESIMRLANMPRANIKQAPSMILTV